MIDFKFPPLGPTGEGEPVYPPGFNPDTHNPRRDNAYIYWQPESYTGYYVLYQLDRPACAFRCHYPGGASPCDQATADRFIEWAKAL